uniref:Uncharacterized protein n=1 Tax=Romanomermis culicivorax TaxID=13658 RepID=A0A915J934_ROMCU
MTDLNALTEEYKRLIMNLVDNAQAVTNTLPQKLEETKTSILSYVPNADTANNLANTIRGYVEDMSPPGDSPDLYK